MSAEDTTSFEKLATMVQRGFAEMREEIHTRFDAVDARFGGVDARFDGMDARFDTMDARFDGIDSELRSIGLSYRI